MLLVLELYKLGLDHLDFLLSAPHVRQQDLKISLLLDLDLLKEFEMFLQSDLANLLSTSGVDQVAIHVPLYGECVFVFDSIHHRVTELAHAVHFPLSLQLPCRLVLDHVFVQAESTEDVRPKAALDLDCGIVHAEGQLPLLDQRVEIENVHVHHHVDRDVLSQVFIVA